MAQYYSSLFQSGLATKAPPAVPGPGPVPSSSRHQPSASLATMATASTSATGRSADGSMRFVFGENGSLRAPSRSSTAPAAAAADHHHHHRGHASFLSMGNSNNNTPLAARPSQRAPPPPSPPSPSLSVHSTQSHLMRSPPSPVPSTRSLKPSSSMRRANVHSELPPGATTVRKASNASSYVRRTNRTQALAALEGRPDQPRLRPVPESRSFVPFDDSEDEEEEDEREKFQRFVEQTRAAAIREKDERERALRIAEDHERRNRASRRVSAAATPTGYSSYFPAPPSSAQPHAYSQNFIDLDDDNASTRTRSTIARSLASLSISGPSSKRSQPPPAAANARPGWPAPPMHIASAA